MIDYKLAKQLRKVGLPQKKYFGGLHVKENGVVPKIRTLDSVYIPTLSELIEACGDGFGGLFGNSKKGFWCYEELFMEENNPIKGKTPLIAVAKLYIKLNEKVNN